MFRIKCEEKIVVYINEDVIRLLIHDSNEKQVTIIEQGKETPTKIEKVIEVERID
jgi:hypothetical protein